MLVLAVTLISLVILVGLYMSTHILQKKPFPKLFSYAHLGMAALGAILTIIAATKGGILLWANTALAVIVATLGFMLTFGKFGKRNGRSVLALHAILASICYLFLVYNTFF